MKGKRFLYVMILVFLTAQLAFSQTVQWEQVGESGIWANVTHAVGVGTNIFTVEDGKLYITNSLNGEWKFLNEEYANVQFLLNAGLFLYTVETDGHLYVCNPKDGTWKRLSQDTEWGQVDHAVGLKGKLYTVESGILYATDTRTGEWAELSNEYANVAHLFATGNWLYTIETDGHLYRCSPDDGSWEKISQEAEWAQVDHVIGHNGKIYSVEQGILYETDPDTGQWKEIGNEYANVKFLISTSNYLYTIETDGNLYRIYVDK